MPEHCLRCGKRVDPFKMIGGRSCIACYEKSLQLGPKALKFSTYFDWIFNYTPIIAGIIGFLYLLITPADYSYFIIFIISTIGLSIVCLVGMFPFIFYSMNTVVVEDLEMTLKTEKIRFEYKGMVSCSVHPERNAKAICIMCLKPYCEADFHRAFQTPFYCQNCAPKNYSEISLLNGITTIVSITFLSIVAWYFEVIVFRTFSLSIIPFIFLVIISMFFVLNYYWRIKLKWAQLFKHHKVEP